MNFDSPNFPSGPVPHLRAVPTWYRGIRFRSTLEADWAATFDRLDWYWQYEPVAVHLPDGQAYLCDFHLPTQRVWCEVKGPHNERIDKPIGLHQSLEPDEWDIAQHIVVILRPAGPGDAATWHGAAEHQNIVIVTCPEYQHMSFMDYHGIWACRRGCYNEGDNKFWLKSPEGLRFSGGIAFTRAPRDQP